MKDDSRGDVLNGLLSQEEETTQAAMEETSVHGDVSEQSIEREKFVQTGGSQEKDEGEKSTEQNEDRPAPIAACTVRMDSAFQKSFTKNIRLVWLVAMIVGLVLLVCYIVFSVLSSSGQMQVDEALCDLLLWCGAIAFGFGLVLSITIASSIRKLGSSPVLTNVFNFYESDFVLYTYRLDEKIGAVRLRYCEMAKITERKEFFLLRYNAATIYAVPKQSFTASELAQLRAAFMLPQK